MGVNLKPELERFKIRSNAYFMKVISSDPSPSGTFPMKNGSVEEGCVTEGRHRILQFATIANNIGDENLVIGRPEDRMDIYERAEHMPNGWITKEPLYKYTLKDEAGQIIANGSKRAWCILDHSTFSCTNQGISVGDHDEYGTDQNCQFLVIDGLSDGNYSLEVIINPKQVFKEDNYEDNIVIKNINIEGDFVMEI
jgi:Lysyl oxidase